MIPAARIQATLELLDAIETSHRPADGLASDYFRSRRFIGSKDRAAISAMLYAILRHQARLNWWGEQRSEDRDQGSESTISPRARLLAFLVLIEKKPSKDIDAIFSGKKFSPPVLTDDERKFLKKIEGHTIEHPEMPADAIAECPAWASELLHKRFGKNFLCEMKALTHPAPLDLRVNSLKTTREKVMTELKHAGIGAEPCKLSPLGVRLEERPSLRVLPMLKTGSADIQDEGSQLVAALVDARPGQRVMDFCAGAGGKTLAIAAQMQNKGRIVACDVLEKRLKRSTERFRLAGLHNIDVRPLKNENDPWVKRHRAGFDRVLVDAPCSGTGTWRRNPDQRWRQLGPGLATLIPLQASILASASRLVKLGGRLVYATCSLLPQENEQQVDAFLAAHPEFRLINYSEILKGITPCPDPYLMLTPAQHETDGFFGAVMQREDTKPSPEIMA
jgi:16S rRNA (cytosine967-C5)-methyltransferase